MDKIKNILDFAMRMEKDASDFYSYYADKVKSEDVKKLFNELAVMEKGHYDILKSKFDELGYKEPVQTISWVVDNSSTAKDPHILADISDLAGSEVDFSDISVIRMAYLIENDFSEFYKNAINAVDEPDVKAFLSSLSDWENQHKEFFYKKYKDMLQKHWSNITSIIFA